MTSKFLKVSALALLLSATTSQSSKLQDGLYVGVSHGWNYLTLNGAGTDGAAAVTTNFNKYYSGFEGRLFAGYEDRYGDTKFVWGAELFGGYQNGDTGRLINGSNVAYTRVNQEYGFGAKFKAGWGITDATTLYLNLSAINTRFQIEHAPSGGGGAGRIYSGSSMGKNLWGVAPGLGLKVALDNKWSIHGDAYYAFYESFKKDLSGDAAGGQTFNFRMNPRQVGISVGISYKINPSHN